VSRQASDLCSVVTRRRVPYRTHFPDFTASLLPTTTFPAAVLVHALTNSFRQYYSLLSTSLHPRRLDHTWPRLCTPSLLHGYKCPTQILIALVQANESTLRCPPVVDLMIHWIGNYHHVVRGKGGEGGTSRARNIFQVARTIRVWI
jgi:hypothetical protein